jgi:hypothetical protein
VNALTLVLSQALALGLGAALVALLVLPRGSGAVATIVGYGYVVGSIAVTLILRMLSIAGIHWTFWLPALLAFVLAAATGFVARRNLHVAPMPGVATVDAAWQRVLAWFLWGLVLVHVALVLNEALLRPLFPWDATAQWSTKARVWFEYRRLVPFVDDMAWIGATGDVFTDAHPNYPVTVPLFQVWAALAWGSFDDAIVNVAWPMFLAALALGTYGQLRRLEFLPLEAVAVAYVIVSLPIVDVHAALAGYADLAVAVVYAFALLAFANWMRRRSWRDAALLALCAVALPMLKTPGWVWLATLIPGILAVYVPRKAMRALVAIGIGGAVALVVYASYVGPISLFGYQIAPQHKGITDALVSNFFLFANWHLLGFLLPLVFLVVARTLLAPALAPLSWVVAAAVTALVLVFFFTSATVEGVGAYTTVNRALLHIVPALVVYAAIVLREFLSTRNASVRDETLAQV